MPWFKKTKAPIVPVEKKKVKMPEGLWTKCKNCLEIIYSKEIERNLNVCPKCDYHFRISASERIELVIDADTFVEMDEIRRLCAFKDEKINGNGGCYLVCLCGNRFRDKRFEQSARLFGREYADDLQLG